MRIVMLKSKFLFILLLTAASASLRADQQIMPAGEVVPGMQGYGLSVFQGDSIERFEVKIIGTMKNFLPKKDIFLAELQGERLRHTGVIAGMSGSPIYIDGKLIGALAYGFQFSKDPICGITPIEHMLEIENTVSDGGGAAGAHGAAAVGPAGNTSALFDPLTAPPNPLLDEDNRSGPTAGSSAAGGAPISRLQIPLSFSGCNPAVMEQYGSLFDRFGLVPLAAGGSGSGGKPVAPDDPTLQPGSAVAAQLIRGDLSLAATGTLTHRDGDRVLAFGHPFLQFGPVDFPMTAAEIVTVLPNMASSFKLSNTTDFMGSIRGDHTNGIFGVIGAQPQMVPVEITLKLPTLPVQHFNYEMIRHKRLSPVLAAMTALNSLSEAGNTVTDQTLKVKGTVEIEGAPGVNLENTFAGPAATTQFMQQVLMTMQYLYGNVYGPANVKRIEFKFEVSEGLPRAAIAEVQVDEDELYPGDTLTVDVTLNPFVTTEFRERFTFVAPNTDQETRLFLLVGSGDYITRTEFQLSPGRFLYKNLGELVGLLNKTRKNNILYAKAFTMDQGLVLDGNEMPELPGSVWAMLKSRKSSGVTLPLNDKVVAEFEKPTDYVLSGFRLIQLTLKPKL
jgi:hypothetical protein